MLKTTLVVSGDDFPAASDEYKQAVTRFMAESSLEMADSAFITQAHVLDNVRFENTASVWLVESSPVSLLEAANVVKRVAPTSEPLVSAIVTSFNRPQMLLQAVQSLESQTYSQIEIIVVDDGSTHPDIPAVLQQLELKGVRVIRQTNQYLGAARNNAAREAKGSLLFFLDDDNVALPNMVQTLVKAKLSSSASIVVNAHYLWKAAAAWVQVPDAALLTTLPVWCPVGPAVLAGAQGNVFGNANFLIERQVFYSLSGFSEDRAGWEDYEFHAKAAIAAVTYVVVPEPLMLFRQHSITAQMSFNTDNNQNKRRVLRAYHELLRTAHVSPGAAYRELSSRAVNSCTAAPTITTTSDCVSSTITAVVIGTTGQYGEGSGASVASALLLTVNQNSVDTALSVPADYSYVATQDGANVNYVITFVNNAKVSTLLTEAGNGVATTISISFAFTSSGGAVVSCPNYLVTSGDFGSCSNNVCFHKDTIIEYEGERFGLEGLRKHADCVIPHVVTAHGVSIHTSCAPESPLRLTKTHLVFTSAGLRKAQDIEVGHVVYGDVAQKIPCTVTSVDEDVTQQEFFGLNCLASTVLASNIKTSTFGDIHAIPSMWMAYVGRVFGIERASRWGSAMADLAHSVKIL